VNGAALRVEAALTPAARRDFLDLPYNAYRADPAWRAPLRFERAEQIDPKHNPGLARMDAALFVAYRGQTPAGRIAAFVNPAHIEQNGGATGHFGFLDTLAPDPEAVAGLVSAAKDWLRARGMGAMAGPFNFSVNEECGLLVDGFEAPPKVMMPHGRPDYAPALEALGFKPVMNMYAFLHRMEETYATPRLVARMIRRFEKDPGLEIRPLDTANFRREVEMVMDIFNDAWSENWGYVPFSADQIAHMAASLRPLIRPDGLWIGLADGEPVHFTLMIPDLNEAVHGLDGRLFPFGWLQLLNRLKLRGTRGARIPLAGTRRAFHKSPRAMSLNSAAFDACMKTQHARGVREVEFSWVLETNSDLINLVSVYGGERYKTYRIYETQL